jgi:lipopolysaccharide/colanic/teichoic acid biosynthesis glycosyltransferase
MDITVNRNTATASQVDSPDVITSPLQPSLEPSLGPVSRYDRFVRPFQAAVSIVGLILLSPLFLFIAVTIKLTDGGSVFYSGSRVGQGKRIFKIYKFRSLAEGAEKIIGGRLLSEEDRDQYCTKIGRFLRRTKLDELPQLFNVIRGDMRLVGPRPVRPIFLEEFEREIPNYDANFLVPPGMTGIGQLRGGYFISRRQRLRYDLIYIRNRSFFLDFKLILLTFVKILDRWLNRGFFVLFLFLFASLIPANEQPAISLPFFDGQINLVDLFIVLVGGWLFFNNGPTRFSLYRSPLNLPVVIFIVYSLFSAFFMGNYSAFLQQTGYEIVTGFLVSFLIVNSLAARGFFTFAARFIALTSVMISLIGLFQIFQLLDLLPAALSTPPDSKLIEGYARISSILGRPIILSVYLVLGLPLLLAEVIQSDSQRKRDFWLICTTISGIGIFLTQSRIGLLALLVTGTVFLSQRLRYAFIFSTIVLCGFLLALSLGVSRFSPTQFSTEVTAWAQEMTPVLQTISTKRWLLGGAVRTDPRSKAVSPDSPLGIAFAPHRGPFSPDEHEVEIANMHFVLVMEHGVVGWFIIMWIIFASLRAMKRAYDRTKDERLRLTLWAIISSVVGFLVSMNGMNTFYNLTLQIFFWSLIGIGLGIVIHVSGYRRHNLIWRFSVIGAGGD